MNNKFHYNGNSANGGFGIVVAGSMRGNGSPGTPKLDEVPIYNEIINNDVYYNKDDGIRIKGARFCDIRGNNCYENGQRIASNFRNIYITSVGGSADGTDNSIVNNTLYGSQLKQNIEIVPTIQQASLLNNIPNEIQDIPYSSNIFSALDKGNIIRIILNGNISTIHPPIHFHKGSKITFIFIQDSIGGRTISGWDQRYKHNWNNTGNTANSIKIIKFIYDGTNWIQESFETI